ncbi:MAG: ATP-binding protein [Acidimicrobiia bacterium]|nr:ATP-binding protein [Acidimicrobiia bacterium]
MAPSAHDRGDAVEIQIPPRTEYLAMVRGFVSEVVAGEAGVDAQRLEDLRVAVSEAVTNAIAAHAGRGIADPVRIRCVPSPGRVEIQVHDRGGGFDPSRVPEPPEPADPRRLYTEKGMGLWLMRIMSDDHAISTSRRGTEVRLVVHTSSS